MCPHCKNDTVKTEHPATSCGDGCCSYDVDPTFTTFDDNSVEENFPFDAEDEIWDCDTFVGTESRGQNYHNCSKCKKSFHFAQWRSMFLKNSPAAAISITLSRAQWLKLSIVLQDEGYDEGCEIADHIKQFDENN